MFAYAFEYVWVFRFVLLEGRDVLDGQTNFWVTRDASPPRSIVIHYTHKSMQYCVIRIGNGSVWQFSLGLSFLKWFEVGLGLLKPVKPKLVTKPVKA